MKARRVVETYAIVEVYGCDYKVDSDGRVYFWDDTCWEEMSSDWHVFEATRDAGLKAINEE
jgi:hypothetical protein